MLCDFNIQQHNIYFVHEGMCMFVFNVSPKTKIIS